MTLTRKHHYTVKLYFKQDWVIQLKGFSFGYYGEGSRGSMAILKECGFSQKQINRIFQNDIKKVRLMRRVS